MKPMRKRRPSQRDKRKPFADRVPRPVKRVAGRTTPPRVPANIRTAGVTLDADAKANIRRRLGMKLGKFAKSIERVTVRVEDVNGPRGGVDHRSNIKVVLTGLPSVVVQTRAPTANAAVNRALAGAERAVRRALRRRRTKPRTSLERKRRTRSI
jgi:hypothetical protein